MREVGITSDTRVSIAKKKVEHYTNLLNVAWAVSSRDALERILREAKLELSLAEADEDLAASASPIHPERVQRWRLKAEEYRATAEICRSAPARENYLRLARDYERLVDQSEGNPSVTAEASDGHRRYFGSPNLLIPPHTPLGPVPCRR